MTDEREEDEELWERDQRLESIASRDEPFGLHANIKPPRQESDEASRGAANPVRRLLDRLRKLVGGHG